MGRRHRVNHQSRLPQLYVSTTPSAFSILNSIVGGKDFADLRAEHEDLLGKIYVRGKVIEAYANTREIKHLELLAQEYSRTFGRETSIQSIHVALRTAIEFTLGVYSVQVSGGERSSESYASTGVVEAKPSGCETKATRISSQEFRVESAGGLGQGVFKVKNKLSNEIANLSLNVDPNILARIVKAKSEHDFDLIEFVNAIALLITHPKSSTFIATLDSEKVENELAKYESRASKCAERPIFATHTFAK